VAFLSKTKCWDHNFAKTSSSSSKKQQIFCQKYIS
jgi:hypothetical protein